MICEAYIEAVNAEEVWQAHFEASVEVWILLTGYHFVDRFDRYYHVGISSDCLVQRNCVRSHNYRWRECGH